MSSKHAYLSWVICSSLLLAALIYFSVLGFIQVRNILLVLGFSAVFPIIAMSYRRYILGTKEGADPYRQVAKINEFRTYVARSWKINSGNKTDDQIVEELSEDYSSEYSTRAYAMCVIPAIAVSIIGWSILLEPVSLDLLPSESNDVRGSGSSLITEHTEPSQEPTALGKPEDVTTSELPTTSENAEAPEKTAAADETEPELSVTEKPTTTARSKRLDDVVLTAMGVGFLGSLLFCFQLLWQRITTEDLKPTIFVRCAMAMFAGLVFPYVVFSATGSFSKDFNGNEDPSMSGTTALIGYIVAFSLGYFPMLATRWFTRVANNSLGEPARRADSQRLITIDGITIFHEERLLEEGIHNIHDMAFADLGKLLITTPYNANQLLDWSDQSIMLLFLNTGEAESFRRGGIRSAECLLRIWKPLYKDPSVAAANQNLPTEERNQYALLLQTTPLRLDCVYLALAEEKTTP